MSIAVSTSDPDVLRLLSNHPDIALREGASEPCVVEIDQDGWKRELVWGDPSVEVSGLIESMDNNPMVCADIVGVPGPAATLALIALEPLIRVGLLLEPPAIQVAGCTPEDVDAWLARSGWIEGSIVSFGDEELSGVIAANVIALIPGETSNAELVGLFEEAYGRSLYVRSSADGPWDTSLVKNRPFARYRTTIGPSDGTRLATIKVMADRNGKAGAAQIVHALNVMCGIEECQGIPD